MALRGIFKASVENGGSLNGARAKAALRFWIGLLPYAPPEATSSTWDEVGSSFAAGRTARGWVYGENASWIAQDAERSLVPGKVGAESPRIRSGGRMRGDTGQNPLRSTRTAWLPLSPTLVVLGVTGLLPFLYVLYVGFFEWNPLSVSGEMRWTGADNDRALVFDEALLLLVWRAVRFTLSSVTIELVLGFLLAHSLLTRIACQLWREPYVLPESLGRDRTEPGRHAARPVRHHARTGGGDLIIQADQMAPQALPIYGHPLVEAPGISALADEGVVFENACCNFPLCVPSRYSMLTGRHTSAIGAWDNAVELASERPTMAHYLDDLGYDTILCGKMHFIGPDQLHGFRQRLTTDIYPSNFAWTPDWPNEPEYRPTGISLRPVVQAGQCVRSLRIDYDDEVEFYGIQKIHDLARYAGDDPFFLVISFTHPQAARPVELAHCVAFSDNMKDEGNECEADRGGRDLPRRSGTDTRLGRRNRRAVELRAIGEPAQHDRCDAQAESVLRRRAGRSGCRGIPTSDSTRRSRCSEAVRARGRFRSAAWSR